jgi:glycerate 2-kinase
MIIQNFQQLATTSLRKQALLIGEAGFEAIITKKIIRERVSFDAQRDILEVRGQQFHLSSFQRVVCVGFGKAAYEGVTELAALLGPRLDCGLSIDVQTGAAQPNVRCLVGSHPSPSAANIQATDELLAMLTGLTAADLVVCVVSGGGSSLLCAPHDMTCETQSNIVAALTSQGATIQELNTVRKHLSRVKGGQLAKLCYPATMVSLIFSDVPGDDLSMVASGPTVLDTTTVYDAQAVLYKYEVLKLCHLPACSLLETPKEPHYFTKVHNILLVSGQDALLAMTEKAQELGWQVQVWPKPYQGNARELGPAIVQTTPGRTCLLGAGESTVLVRGHGLEGRNQALALAALPYVAPNQVLVSLASDGCDHSDAAGAIVDQHTQTIGHQLLLEPQQYLDANDSFHFFEQTGDLIYTGLTGANVADFFVCLKE